MYIFHFLAKKSKNWVLKFTPNFEKWLTRGKNVKSRCPLGVLVLSKCTNLIPKFQEGTITQKAKKNSQSWQKRSQNFAFLDTLGYLVPVRSNDLRQLNQIWHTSSQCSGASSCKILDTWLNFDYRFFPKNAQKMIKKSKIWFF